MSYAIRNTIILLVVLSVLCGTGWAYFKFVQESQIEQLTTTLDRKTRDYNNKRSIADGLPLLQQQFDEAQQFINNFDKTLFKNNNPDNVFKFLSDINIGSDRIQFNFVFADSSTQNQYGIINSNITGEGNFNSVYNFINRIENSQPVQKIENIVLTPVGQVGSYDRVSFSFTLRSYYDRVRLFTNADSATPFIARRSVASERNPFFPLIRDVEPNVDGLVNAEASRLVGISGNSIFLINQEGRMINLNLNDRVYLGYLESINMQQGRATFRLNKGGIIEVITLEVQR